MESALMITSNFIHKWCLLFTASLNAQCCCSFKNLLYSSWGVLGYDTLGRLPTFQRAM